MKLRCFCTEYDTNDLRKKQPAEWGNTLPVLCLAYIETSKDKLEGNKTIKIWDSGLNRDFSNDKMQITETFFKNIQHFYISGNSI